MCITNLTPNQLRRAAQIKEQIASLQNELNKLAGLNSAPAAQPQKAKWTMSAAGRARIVAAQKIRWAKVRAAKKK